jgi:hypothetical protein
MKTIPVLAALALFSLSPLASLTATQAGITTIYTVTEGDPAGLTAANGTLYGATYATYNCGTVFQLQPPVESGGPWVEMVLYSFTGLNGDGCAPGSAPVIAASGALYGITSAGGAYHYGGFYQLRPPESPGAPWTESMIYDFGSSLEVGSAWSNLVRGPTGSFFFMASNGVNDDGALAQLLPPAAQGEPWTVALLYSLPANDTVGPSNSLTMGPDGAFYVTTTNGGTKPGMMGTVYELQPPSTPGGSWTETVLHEFAVNDGFAGGPDSTTVSGSGPVFGTTFGHGYLSQGTGSVFELIPPASSGGTWGYAVLKDFGQKWAVDSPLILRNGKLYGTVYGAGGGVFELQPPAAGGGRWTFNYLHIFSDGQMPSGTLVMDKNGTIYGSTVAPYAQQPGGTIYQITTR